MEAFARAAATVVFCCVTWSASSAQSSAGSTSPRQGEPPPAVAVPAKSEVSWSLFVSDGSGVVSYRFGRENHATLLCKHDGASYYSGVAADKDGNLMVPQGDLGNSMTVYAGPGMCGREFATVTWPISDFGYPVDAASLNVRTGKIVIAMVPPFSLSGGVLVCRLSGSCSEILDESSFDPNGATAVAIDSAGDCWASAELENASKSGYYPALEYFHHCEAPGVKARGWLNAAGGGLDVDQSGNVLSISAGSPSRLYVYQGCRPQCRRIGGPFTLLHAATFGHVSRDGSLFASTGEGVVDIYDYSSTTLAHRFSFRVGKNSVGVAFSPGR